MNWLNFKTIVDNLQLNIQLLKEHSKYYKIIAYNGINPINCSIKKTNPRNLDQIDFEDNYLTNINGALTQPVIVTEQTINSPFASKTLPNGSKVFRRTHGFSAVVAGAPDTLDFNIPYNFCKITGIEIINGELGDKMNLKVLDTPTGSISGVPNYELNQFGFDTYVADKLHRYESNYDADLLKDMKIRIEYDAINSNLLPKTIYVNIILHEVVPVE